jgi:hypothetical protein
VQKSLTHSPKIRQLKNRFLTKFFFHSETDKREKERLTEKGVNDVDTEINIKTFIQNPGGRQTKTKIRFLFVDVVDSRKAFQESGPRN